LGSWTKFTIPVLASILILGNILVSVSFDDAFADKTVTIDLLSPGEYVIIPNSLVISNGERVTFDVTDAAVIPCIGEAKLRIDISADDVFPDDEDPILLLNPTITDTSYTTGPFEWPSGVSTYTYDLTVWCAFSSLTPIFDGTATFEKTASGGGVCLIATAAYGSELAPQVQFLREIRDNTVMSTNTGAAFMTGFNQLYYSFSPTIADMERENPMFQELVRAFITPMISTLSIMTLAEEGNEVEIVGLGISVIALNLGMYIAAPTLIGFKAYTHLKTRNYS